MRDPIHTIAYRDIKMNTRGEMRYTEAEMNEVFSMAERHRLAQGKIANRGDLRYVDATVIAQQALDASFGE